MELDITDIDGKKHLVIPQNQTIDAVQEYSVQDATTDLQIHAEARSSATVSIVIDPDDDVCKCSLHIVVDAGAKLTVLLLQVAKSKSVSISQSSQIADGAHLRLHNITLGGEDVSHDIESHLLGQHAVSDIDWIFYARNKEKQKLSATNVFEGRAGGGEINMRGVAQDSAHVVCNGMINIGEGGGETDTYLTEEVLMLDKTAKVDAIPGLEIKTNDVKASHSATVAKVTEADLFYFAARGIPTDQARQMYVLGFLEDLTKRIAAPDLSKKVLQEVEKKYMFIV
ncbi:MAG: SufD family Fe-S cluster assembly protein [bacterium]|nr:SufD family Fe-S cluster assembly protein [bacterium]